jgi:hypothetical protein
LTKEKGETGIGRKTRPNTREERLGMRGSLSPYCAARHSFPVLGRRIAMENSGDNMTRESLAGSGLAVKQKKLNAGFPLSMTSMVMR